MMSFPTFMNGQSLVWVLLVLVTGSVAEEINLGSQSIVFIEIFNHCEVKRILVFYRGLQ